METFSAQPHDPPKRKSKFQIFLLLGLITILVVVVILDVLSFMGKIDFKNKGDTAESSPMTTTESKNSKTVSNKPGKTWNDCKVLPNEKSYLPQHIGNEYTADSIGPNEPNGYLAKYYQVPSVFFSVQIKKRSAGEDGDIDKRWQLYNQQYSPLGPKLVRKTYFGNEASLVSGDSGEGPRTLIYSLIPSHNIFIEINAKGDRIRAENYYNEWFNAVCQPK